MGGAFIFEVDMIVYRAVNNVSGKAYIGMTKGGLSSRISSHMHSVKVGSKTYFHNALRKYGLDGFSWSVAVRCHSQSHMESIEKHLIQYYKHIGCYNIADGGSGGFVVPDGKIDEWKGKLSKARAGRKPALGMKHTEENKKFFSECAKRKELKYPDLDAVNTSYKDASGKYGISKTHFYRLRKRQTLACSSGVCEIVDLT